MLLHGEFGWDDRHDGGAKVASRAGGLVDSDWFVDIDVPDYFRRCYPGGKFADVETRRAPDLSLSAIAVFTLASLLCAMSHNLSELVVARSFQGVGAALMVPVGRIVVLANSDKTDIMRPGGLYCLAESARTSDRSPSGRSDCHFRKLALAVLTQCAARRSRLRGGCPHYETLDPSCL